MAAAPAHGAARVVAGPVGSATTRRRQTLAAWLFALPFLVLFVVFMAGPVLASLTMSFTDFTSRDLRNPLAVGLRRARQLHRALSDDRSSSRSAVNTGYFVVVGIPLTHGRRAGRWRSR